MHDPKASRPRDETSHRDDGAAKNFIAEMIDEDLRQGKNGGRVQTRFPPEPNGYLHIGHAKAICLNFEMAEKSPNGACNLRYDDTNPIAEDEVFVQAIERDVRWLGYEPTSRIYFASDYFPQLYQFALQLIDKGLAYVDSQSPDDIKENRGNYYKVGKESPFRDRSPQENRELLQRMKNGEFEEGECVLRAKTQMDHKNVLMRDPLIYRIRKASHHRTGSEWCIYPMYDFAHPLSDAIEGVTHSLCTLEFESHRPLYDWFVDNVGDFDPRPEQTEFARLNLGYTVLSKRKLIQLVEEDHVAGWDDPRMPTISGMRRRGYLPQSIRAFCDRIGVAKRDSRVDVSLLEHRLREDLNAHANRTMAVLNPLRVTIDNFPEDQIETFEVPVHPEYPDRGSRTITLTREIFVERDDYMDDPPKKWFRLSPGREVRLRGACLLTCKEVERDENGEPIHLICSWDPNSRGGSAPDGRKVRGTLHFISKADALPAQVRLYDRLFTDEEPDVHEEKSFLEFLNPDSLKIAENAWIHRDIAGLEPETRVQFERLGYFCVDQDSTPERPIFNRTITLRDSWAKVAKKG